MPSFQLLLRHLLLMLLLSLTACCVIAGGGPESVLIVMNARSRESLEIGNSYRRARGIPYRQVVILNTAPSHSIPLQTYFDEIETPIRAYLKSRQLEEQITTLVLTRGLPQLVTGDAQRATASLLATLGMREAAGTVSQLANPYLDHPEAFSHRLPALRGMYLVGVLNGYNTQDIQRLITLGASADGSMPDGRFVLQASPQISGAANAAAADLLQAQGFKAEVTNTPPTGADPLMGYFSGGAFSGLTWESIKACAFRPGAIADMAQNYSAAPVNFEETGTTVLLPVSWFIQTGITGIHGLVADAGPAFMPSIKNQKIVLDRYTRGYSLAESFFAAMPALNRQNVVLGDPLCAPYGLRPTVTLETGRSPLKGERQINVLATAHAPASTITRIELYVDGHFTRTLYEPMTAKIQLHIGDTSITYVLPQGATMHELLEGLAAAINTNRELSGPGGVRAEPLPAPGALRLIARTPGEAGNKLAFDVHFTGEGELPPGISARVERGGFAGGGLEPTAAKATLTFVGRRVDPGDTIELRIQQQRLQYTVPEGQLTISAMLDALVAMINNTPALQLPGGVFAQCDPQGMPFIVLEARTPGQDGNLISFHLTLTTSAGSPLHGYPEMPATLSGGQNGSAAALTVNFALGSTTAQGAYLLKSAELPDGYHRLLAVAYDSSPARLQGYKETALTTANLAAPPIVTLPPALGPVSGEVEVPISAPPAAKVNLYVDGQLLGATAAGETTCHLNLATLGRGTHDLWAEGLLDDGSCYLSAPAPLTVSTPPEIFRITPEHTALTGGTIHRIIGTGFLPECSVKLAGVTATFVTVLNPNLLEVVSEPGAANRGSVEVTNPDHLSATLPEAFEYYTPHVTEVRVTPASDVLAPGNTVALSASSFDQFGHALNAALNWEATGGSITPTGLFTAPALDGHYTVRVNHPDHPTPWEVPITVGPLAAIDGRIRHWLVLGGFPDPDYTGLETALIPEETVKPSHGQEESGKHWHPLSAATDFIDFGAQLTPNSYSVAYAHVYLYAPAETPCTLVFGSDDGIRLWLNGENCFSLRIRRAASPNQNKKMVTLKAGWNRLLVKVDKAVGIWGFYLRLQTPGGQPLTGISYQLDAPG